MPQQQQQEHKAISLQFSSPVYLCPLYRKLNHASTISPTQFRDLAYICTAVLDALSPATTNFYTFSSDNWSDEHSFTTAAGDQDTYTNAFSAIANVERILDIELVLHVGDLICAWGNGYAWEISNNMIARVASTYMVCTFSSVH